MQAQTLAAIRFGTGLSPRLGAPDGAEGLLAGLTRADEAVARFPVRSFGDRLADGRQYAELNTARREGGEAERQAMRDFVRSRNRSALMDLAAQLGRAALGPDPFRERLVLFWANHFTIRARNPRLQAAVPAYVDAAIRPNVAGSFSELLRAAVLHPMMLQFLDQHVSAGPGSRAARRGRRGLNENLAREVLELHTLGSDGSYGQADVEGLARVLTGASFNFDEGFEFREAMAEPGVIRVLGREYGGPRPRSPGELADIEAVLDDLSRHPDTARHIARKLAIHFIGDDPDPALVAHLAERFIATDGALLPVYEALLEHPAAWVPRLAKARMPFDFLAAGLRALDLNPMGLEGKWDLLNRHFNQPLELMGQPYQRPPSPAGWPEAAMAWISPQGLAARIKWAMAAPRALARRKGDAPDPRAFLETALADAADADLRFAAAGAESRWDGVGVVLASPAFNRR